MNKVILLSCLIIWTGCNPQVSIDGGSPAGESIKLDFNEGPAAGRINSADWVFVSGTAKVNSFDANRLQISLYSEATTAECFGIPAASAVITSVPMGLGEVSFGSGNPMQTATIYYSTPQTDSANLIVTEGRIRIVNITEDKVEGQIVANYDSQNNVNGSFTLKFCAQ